MRKELIERERESALSRHGQCIASSEEGRSQFDVNASVSG
jgi:hypothetical protein